MTIPGMLDLEDYTGKPACYGLNSDQIFAYIRDFVFEYLQLIQRFPMIYTKAPWWIQCTADSPTFHNLCPLVLANYNRQITTIPGRWATQHIWQYSEHYQYGGDADRFNGDMAALVRFARGPAPSNNITGFETAH